MVTEKKIREILTEVLDPELNINIIDLGLVYDIKIDQGNVLVTMTLTTPGCPLSSFFRKDISDRLTALPGVTKGDVMFVFEPLWDYSRITDSAKAQLGFLG